jgi:hypothetical protein
VENVRLTARLCRLVAKSPNLALLLIGLGTKADELLIGSGRVLRHEIQGTKQPPLALGDNTLAADARRGDATAATLPTRSSAKAEPRTP